MHTHPQHDTAQTETYSSKVLSLLTIDRELLARLINTSKASYIVGIVMVVFGFGGLVLLVPSYVADMKYGNTGVELASLLITIIILIIGFILSLTSEH